jgi:regulator of replication initiation timing
MESRICRICNIEKPLKCFDKTVSGYRHQCRPCRLEKLKASKMSSPKKATPKEATPKEVDTNSITSSNTSVSSIFQAFSTMEQKFEEVLLQNNDMKHSLEELLSNFKQQSLELENLRLRNHVLEKQLQEKHEEIKSLLSKKMDSEVQVQEKMDAQIGEIKELVSGLKKKTPKSKKEKEQKYVKEITSFLNDYYDSGEGYKSKRNDVYEDFLYVYGLNKENISQREFSLRVPQEYKSLPKYFTVKAKEETTEAIEEKESEEN